MKFVGAVLLAGLGEEMVILIVREEMVILIVRAELAILIVEVSIAGQLAIMLYCLPPEPICYASHQVRSLPPPLCTGHSQSTLLILKESFSIHSFPLASPLLY